jgi:hypothetical protein
MLTNGGKIADWIEDKCCAPDGTHGGEHMVLLPFQRATIYRIYNNYGTRGTILPAGEIEEELDEHDRAALTAAMERARAHGRGPQLDAMLTERSWQRVAQFAAYSCQCAALELKPHETPPCHINNPETVRKEEQTAAKLLRRMLRHGVSKYDPDPRAALAAAESAP